MFFKLIYSLWLWHLGQSTRNHLGGENEILIVRY